MFTFLIDCLFLFFHLVCIVLFIFHWVHCICLFFHLESIVFVYFSSWVRGFCLFFILSSLFLFIFHLVFVVFVYFLSCVYCLLSGLLWVLDSKQTPWSILWLIYTNYPLYTMVTPLFTSPCFIPLNKKISEKPHPNTRYLWRPQPRHEIGTNTINCP